jgi:hypothetical protein
VTASTIAPRPTRSLPISPGITPTELAARARRGTAGINPRELERWLIREGYATSHDGVLVPTRRVPELAWT